MDPKIKDLRGTSRRRFLRLMAVAAAGYGVGRSDLLGHLADLGGSALADDGSCATTNRSVHIVSGGGNFAWWQLLWPLVDVAKGAQANPQFAYHGFDPNANDPNAGPGFEHLVAGRPFYYGPEAPWVDLAAQAPSSGRAMTAFMAGVTKTHDRQPLLQTAVIDGDHTSGTSLLAAVASIQHETASLLPVIGVAPFSYGVAPGAPAPAVVPSAAAMLDLFNSAASRAVLLAQEDKDRFETYYKAVLSLRTSATRPTWTRQLDVMKVAANVVGRNLADKLTPTQLELDTFGITELLANIDLSAGAKERLQNFGMALLITKKAMAEGLTSSVILGLPPAEGGADGFTDPHAAFTDMKSLRATLRFMGLFLQSFYAELATAPDPACTAKTLAERVILTVHGDQPHTPLDRNTWPDSTPGDTNWMYVMGNGYLQPGWFGRGKTDNSLDGWDPTTGGIMPHDELGACHAASAAVLYAVAAGDMTKVSPFYKGPAITGVIA